MSDLMSARELRLRTRIDRLSDENAALQEEVKASRDEVRFLLDKLRDDRKTTGTSRSELVRSRNGWRDRAKAAEWKIGELERKLKSRENATEAAA